MGIFSRRKTAVQEEESESTVVALEAGTKEAFKARVLRLDPLEHNGVKIGGDIQAEQFTGLHSLPELRELVTKAAGGGKFEARLFEDKVGGKSLTMTHFTLAGEPKIGGKPIEPRDPVHVAKRKQDDDDEPEEVVELKRQESVEEMRHRAELARRRREQELAAVLPSVDDESGQSSSTELLMQKLAEMESNREKQQQEFELRIEQQRREFEQKLLEQQREAERREDRARQDQKFEALQAQIVQLMAGGGKNEMTELMKMMKQSSDENLKLLVGILSKSSDEKLNLAQMQTETLAKTFQAGINAGSGKIGDDEEEQPKDLAGVVNAQVGKVIDLVGQYVMNRPSKAPMTEAEVAQMSRAIAATIKAEQSAASERQLARVTPQPVAAPAAAQPAAQPAPQQQPADARPPADPGKRMNMLLKKIIRDARAGKATEDSFLDDARRYLSPEVMQELILAFHGGGADKVLAVMRKYGDARLVDEAYRATIAEVPVPAENAEPADEVQPAVKGQPRASVKAEQAAEE